MKKSRKGKVYTFVNIMGQYKRQARESRWANYDCLASVRSSVRETT